MKKKHSTRLMAWALVVAMPLWFGSCKKGGDDAVTPSASSIEGNWKISAYTIDPGVDFLGTGQKTTDLLAFYKSFPNGVGDDIIACLTSTVITFNSNGKITGQSGSKCTASTDMSPVDDNSAWKLDGSKLTITSGRDITTYDVVVTNNTLSMSNKQSEDFDGDGKAETYTVTLQLTKA